MILLLNKRHLTFMFTGLFFLGLSLGAYRLAAHPEMKHWEEQKLVISRVQTNEKVVALTFDDGPDPKHTPVVLDSLNKKNAKATFFVMGNKAEKNPELLKEMVAAGHEIGNHSYSHADYRNKNHQYLENDIKETNDLIFRLTASKPVLFRPPGGFLSHELIEITQKNGLTVAYWSYETDSKDWVNGKSAESIANHIVRKIKPGQIIILHDGCPNGMQTAHAVSIILDRLSSEGYRFVTMSELINLGKTE